MTSKEDGQSSVFVDEMCGPEELRTRVGRDVHPLEAMSNKKERRLDPAKAVKRYRRLVSEVEEVRSVNALQRTWLHLVTVCGAASPSEFESFGTFLQDRLRSVRVDLTLNRAAETAPMACAALYLRCAVAQSALSYSMRALFERNANEAFHFEGNRQDVQQAAQAAARAAKIAIAKRALQEDRDGCRPGGEMGATDFDAAVHVLDASLALALIAAAVVGETRLLSAMSGNAPSGSGVGGNWVRTIAARMAEFYLKDFEVLSESAAGESLRELVRHGARVETSHLMVAIRMIRSARDGDLCRFWKVWTMQDLSGDSMAESRAKCTSGHVCNGIAAPSYAARDRVAPVREVLHEERRHRR